jgi:outer membrane autotransporter protein
VQGGVYGRYDGDDNLFVTGFATLGGESIKTKRTVVLGPTTYNLTGKTNGTSPSFSLKVGKAYQVEPGPDALILTPSAEIRYEQANVDSYMEHGGVPAMAFGDYDNGVPTAHLGIDAKKTVGLGDLMLTPSANVGIVEVMGGRVSTIQAAFVGAPTSLMSFDDTPHSSSYGEYGLGLDADLGKTLGSSSALSMRYDSDFGRRDMSYHSWTVSLKFNL